MSADRRPQAAVLIHLLTRRSRPGHSLIYLRCEICRLLCSSSITTRCSPRRKPSALFNTWWTESHLQFLPRPHLEALHVLPRVLYARGGQPSSSHSYGPQTASRLSRHAAISSPPLSPPLERTTRDWWMIFLMRSGISRVGAPSLSLGLFGPPLSSISKNGDRSWTPRSGPYLLRLKICRLL